VKKSTIAVTSILLLLVTAKLAHAAYVAYVSDPLTSINSTNWYSNGSLTASSAGITSSSAGSLVSKATAPTYPNDYLVTATINLPSNTSGGNYGVMARATSNAMLSLTVATGSFYMLEVQNPTFSGGTCSATLSLERSVPGSIVALSSSVIACSNSFTITLVVSGSTLIWYVNNLFVNSMTDTSLASGAPGLNVRAAPAGNTMSAANLFPGDHTAPNAIDPHNISTTSYPNRIDFQWKAPADDANGSGIALYLIYRGTMALAGFDAVLGEFTDNTVAAGTPYTYNIITCDMFYNCTNSIFNATSAPLYSVDPRQIGMPKNGTSWGGGGENINILSGNLNFSLPLLSAKGRGSTTLPIGLNYNSQNWRVDGSGTWNYGRDTGYGYGFRVLAGSIQMFANAAWGVDHWELTDSTGTQYRLDTQLISVANPTPTTSNTGVWATTTDSGTFIYNANTNQLYFPSGTVWTFGCTSLGNEGDETARYPTLIEDTNGNQILIRYKPGVLALDSSGNNIYSGYSNTSGRIDQIEDVRAQYAAGPYVTYQFAYNNDSGVPHLTGITNNISTSEGYSFAYSGSVALTSPWGTAFGNTTELTGITISGVGLGYTLSYESTGSGALNKVVFPYGGYIRWNYADGLYSASRKQREISQRYTSADGTLAHETAAYQFTPVLDSTSTMRQYVYLADATGLSRKVWSFNTPGSTLSGLVATYAGDDTNPSPNNLISVLTTWTPGTFGPYISSTQTIMNWYTNPATKRVDQVIDQFGNLTSMTVYDLGGTVRRTYANTFMSNATTSNYYTASFSSYFSGYIRDRLLNSKVTEAGVTTLLVSNVYDSYTGFSGPTGPVGSGLYPINCGGSAISAATGPREFDSSYTSSVTLRGNLTQSLSPAGTTCLQGFDNTGTLLQAANTLGVVSSATSSISNNYAVPSAITTGSLTSGFQYASNLLPTQAQGPNGDITSTAYDLYARPSSSTSKTGAMTNYYYIASPPQTLSYTNPNSNPAGRVTRTTLDGFGRPIKVESGTGTYSLGTITMSAVNSQVDTTYAPCACSPLGKLSSVTRPHTPGVTNGGKTTYTYDGIGRTVSVVSGGTDSGGSTTTGTTTYAYSGATVTITDPAGKYKIFTTDAVGNLTQVSEPNPAGGSNLLTNYTYDIFARLATVSMPRSTGTQSRTFTYTGGLLTAVTNPENGTVNNYYNSDNTLNYKIDAKGQKIAYSYDSYKRVTQISKYPNGTTEDLCQRVNYYYDTNPYISTYPYNQYTSGRLTAITYAGSNCQWFSSQFGDTSGNNYIEMYAYTQAGQVTNKRFRLWRQTGTTTPYTFSADLEGVYAYDQEGKLASMQYPLGTTYQYTYDNLGRPIQMTDTGTSSNLVSSVTYGPAGEMLSMAGTAVTETRTYNALGQLKTLVGLSGVNLQYNYSSTANNGQIASQYDAASGETITYAYDQLKRLSSASSSAGWGQSFTYDGFGNLTAKSALSGAPPVGVYASDPATNRLTGTMYDSNGNQLYANGSTIAYDVSNRMSISTASSLQGLYEYDPKNQRVYQLQQTYSGSAWVNTAERYYFYGLNGKKIGTYATIITGSGSSTSMSWSLQSTQVFFRGKLIENVSGLTQTDVRGSVGKYYPYGENQGTPPPDSVQFATYTGDSVSGLDYAVNRYYAVGTGRLTSPDPYTASGGPKDPGSWNRYAYASGDPIDGLDPLGQATCDVSSYVEGGDGHGALVVNANCFTVYADMGWAEVYGSTVQSYIGVFPTGSGMTTDQAAAIANKWETQYEMGIFNLYLRSQAKDAVSQISNDCDSVLQAAGISPSALANSALSAFFFDGTQGYNASQSAASWGLHYAGTVGQALQDVDDAFVDGNNVMLGTAALPWSSNFQPLILVHEILHTYTQLGDLGLATALGCNLFGGCNADNASNFITNALQGGCHNLWAAIQNNGGIPH
jgi:RHS repeat-associated protein